MSNGLFDLIEWIAVGFNLIFVVLIIREIKAGWLFGIAGSALSILLFISVQLYSEAILYAFYVLMGIYGWQQWNKAGDVELPVTEWRLVTHLRYMLAGIALSLGLGSIFASQTDAEKPFFDAFSTVFSFLATYLEAKKVLSTWVYWIALNGFSIWLYNERGLPVYAGLMAVYTVLSVVGYYQWRRSYLLPKTG
jgi:nicotinamide mononucleotide transporter